MPVIAIVGAGLGLGLAIAKTFGAQGFNVALVSPSPRKLEPLVARLAKEGIDAAAFSANLFDRASIVSGLAAVTQHFGRIDVLEFSPASPLLPTASATELTHDNVQIHIDFYVHGAVAGVNQVLPDMLARHSGTIILTTGASSVCPHLGRPKLANVALATSGLRTWAYQLHAALAARGRPGRPRGHRRPNVASAGSDSRRGRAALLGALHPARSGGEGLPAGGGPRPILP